MLIAAAERGVKVNVIVYKEVSSILTRELILKKPGLRAVWLMSRSMF